MNCQAVGLLRHGFSFVGLGLNPRAEGGLGTGLEDLSRGSYATNVLSM